MTSLAVAVASDSRGPCGLYMLTDSRITWGDAGKRWDAGCKTFTSKVSPDVFAYCGDAYFAPMILSQAINLFELGIISAPTMSADERHLAICDAVRRSMSTVTFKNDLDTTFFHGSRDNDLMSSRFKLWKTTYYAKKREWEDKSISILRESYLARTDGSGGAAIRQTFAASGGSSTSRRAVYSFCKSLEDGSDVYSGGAPQLVGIWRKGVARNFGMFWGDKLYVGGMEVASAHDEMNLLCFNSLFEICDPLTGQRKAGAKSHASLKE